MRCSIAFSISGVISSVGLDRHLVNHGHSCHASSHIEGWPQEWCYDTTKRVLRWATFSKHLAGQMSRVTGAELVLAQGTRPAGPTTRSQRRPPPNLSRSIFGVGVWVLGIRKGSDCWKASLMVSHLRPVRNKQTNMFIICMISCGNLEPLPHIHINTLAFCYKYSSLR